MKSQETERGVEDSELRKKLLRKIDALEQMNDWVAETPIRHAVSEYLVEARRAIREGKRVFDD